ncbi:MAG: hypothetical protein JSR29_03600 [Nitrospira sp.]|nr:hypothetical protein [Nitrospira sp.]
MFQNYWAQDLAADQTAPDNQSALTYQVLDIEVFVFYHPTHCNADSSWCSLADRDDGYG